jgi:hypothetical protein
LTALDAKSIARDMEKSALRGEDMISPTSPSASMNPSNYYFSNGGAAANLSFQAMAAPPSVPSMNAYQNFRQGSMSSITLPSVLPHVVNSTTSINLPVQGDAWQTLCIRVLPLFNGEGVQGAIEDLNELLRYVS